MENFGEKMGMKTFWSVFGWVGRKENKWWNPDVVSPCPPKSSLSKMKKKLRGKIGHHFWTKTTLLFFIFFFSFSFSFLLNIASSPLFFFFFFYWAGSLHVQCSYSFFLFFSFFYWFRCDFFFYT